MKKIYLAGFDVFAPDAVQRGTKMKQLCEQYGFVGLYPLDNEAENAEQIFEGNLALIETADMVMANLNPFRGSEPDSGTAFEIGYACAKGKAVYGYLQDTRPMQERLGEKDENGFAVENFGMAVNLMLGCTAKLVNGSLEDCLQQAKHATDA